MKKLHLLFFNLLIGFVLQAQESNFKPYILHNNQTELMSTSIADINNDGKLDFVCTDKFLHSVYWLEQNYFGDFEYHSIDTNFKFPFNTLIYDFNGDNLLDIVVGGNLLAIYLQNNDRSFTKTIIDESIKLQSWELKISDLDNDLDMDIVVSSREYGSIFVYKNNDLNFERSTLLNDVPITFCLDINDINQDGKPDILTSSLKTPKPRLLIQKNGFFDTLEICDNTFAVQSKFGYINQDNLLDIVCFSQINNEVHIHYQIEDLKFETFEISQHLSPAITDIIITDLDGNGLNDLVYNYYLGSIDVIYQFSENHFTHDTIYACSEPIDLKQLDYDNDGDLDLIVVSNGQIILLDNLNNQSLDLQKLLHSYLHSPYKKHTVIGFILLLLTLLIYLIFNTYKLTITIEKREFVISDLKHKNTNQQLMNLNYEKVITTIKTESKQTTISANRWKLFLQEFQNTNPEFTQLLQKFKLTKTEFRLAIFLNSQLSSSEISEILSVNIETIYIQRQRLAKKLNLNTVKELEEFISNLSRKN